VALMSEQEKVEDMGGTMRLGSYECNLQPGTLAERLYNSNVIHERHRHRYEFNNNYRQLLQEKGLVLSGLSPDGKLVEIVECPSHPYFIASQFHPEFKSRPENPHPLFRGLIEAALKLSKPAAEAAV
ncbi:MAG: CTP synthase, partial [Candidatus Gastranaerophilales bacterium]|nr:CTP synthase [Candidatus Gastranaerophilales bacterium]